MPKKTVIVEVEDRNPFGEEIDDSVMNEPGRDLLFVPGYSDTKAQRELDLREGDVPQPLERRLQWVRSQRASGDPDGTSVAAWKAKGYSMLTWEEAKKFGYDMTDTAANKGPDGTVRMGDLVLMVTDARTAATHYQRNREAIDSQAEERVYGPLRQSVEDLNRGMGATEKTGLSLDFEIEPQGPKGTGR